VFFFLVGFVVGLGGWVFVGGFFWGILAPGFEVGPGGGVIFFFLRVFGNLDA